MTKKDWRAVRELLISLYHAQPKAEELPVYFIAGDDRPVAEMAEAVKALHMMPEMPWPDDRCIIIGRVDWLAHLHPGPARFTTWLALVRGYASDHPNSNYALAANAADRKAYIMAFAVINEPQWKVEGYSALGVLYRDRVRPYPGDSRKDEYDFERDIRETIEQVGYDPQKAGAFFRACIPPTDTFWRLDPEAVKPQHLLAPHSTTVVGGRFTDACELILIPLAALAMPCHYFVKVSHEGFGTKSMKKRTRDKPLICIVPYDRLYRIYSGGELSGPVPFHFRRGHIRHLWKQAGLNRLALPDDPAERLRLVFRHHVRRVYVHPAWIGDSRFERQGVAYEVMAGESMLN